jgi:hypothetical protein
MICPMSTNERKIHKEPFKLMNNTKSINLEKMKINPNLTGQLLIPLCKPREYSKPGELSS